MLAPVQRYWIGIQSRMPMMAATPPICDLRAIPARKEGRCNAMQTLDLALLSDILPGGALQKMSAFGALTDSFIENLLEGGELLKLTAGETLYHQGERADCFYVVLRGHLAIYQDSDAGREIIHTTGEGESVGFSAMLAMRPRLLSGEATSECIVLKVSSQALAKLQELDNQQFGIFFINLSRDMSRFLSYCILRPPAEGTSPGVGPTQPTEI